MPAPTLTNLAGCGRRNRATPFPAGFDPLRQRAMSAADRCRSDLSEALRLFPANADLRRRLHALSNGGGGE